MEENAKTFRLIDRCDRIDPRIIANNAFTLTKLQETDNSM